MKGVMLALVVEVLCAAVTGAAFSFENDSFFEPGNAPRIGHAFIAIDPGAVSGRARGRALLDYTHGKGADLLVMGAYGRGQVLSFLGLGGATGKVIASCRVPLLLAH